MSKTKDLLFGFMLAASSIGASAQRPVPRDIKEAFETFLKVEPDTNTVAKPVTGKLSPKTAHLKDLVGNSPGTPCSRLINQCRQQKIDSVVFEDENALNIVAVTDLSKLNENASGLFKKLGVGISPDVIIVTDPVRLPIHGPAGVRTATITENGTKRTADFPYTSLHAIAGFSMNHLNAFLAHEAGHVLLNTPSPDGQAPKANWKNEYGADSVAARIVGVEAMTSALLSLAGDDKRSLGLTSKPGRPMPRLDKITDKQDRQKVEYLFAKFHVENPNDPHPPLMSRVRKLRTLKR